MKEKTMKLKCGTKVTRSVKRTSKGQFHILAIDDTESDWPTIARVQNCAGEAVTVVESELAIDALSLPRVLEFLQAAQTEWETTG